MEPREVLSAATSEHWDPSICICCGERSSLRGVVLCEIGGEQSVNAIGWCRETKCAMDMDMTRNFLLLLDDEGQIQ